MSRRANVLPVQCRVPGCSGVALVGYRCPRHSRRGGGWQSSKPMPRGWDRLRAQVLREEPNCGVCGAPAVSVDHLVARAFGGHSIGCRRYYPSEAAGA